MTKPLTILFQPMAGAGHLNACIGVAEVLRESGHRVVFPVSEHTRGTLSAYGFEEELISDEGKHGHHNHGAAHNEEHAKRVDTLLQLSLLEKQRLTYDNLLARFQENANKPEIAVLEGMVNKYKPDVIVADFCLVLNNFFVYPSLIKTGIPWVLLCSANPLSLLSDENLPPPMFGFSINGNKSEWNEYRVKLKEMSKKLHDKYNEWLREHGFKEVSESNFFFESPYLNIYDYPKEIDYSNEVSIPSNIRGFDNFLRTDKTEQFVLPDVFKNKSGKLVYVSMGSMGSGSVKLMKRLVSILSKSPHRFIVSTGQSHDEYELADNMWGQRYLPQTQVLPLVDLVISHGGNNSLTETFYFGKPMIVLPLYGDQLDNAQRLEDTGYGIRLDALNCSETELLEAIEKVINDSELKLKMEQISQRIQTSKSLKKFVELVEALAQ